MRESERSLCEFQKDVGNWSLQGFRKKKHQDTIGR